MCVLFETSFLRLTAERLLDRILPLAPDTVARLDRGANLLLANGGRGTALIGMARRFPRSRFIGLEPFSDDLASARIAARGARLRNLWVEPDDGNLTLMSGLFHFAIRQPHPLGISLSDLEPLLADGGRLFDVQTGRPEPTSYFDSGLMPLNESCLREGWCVVAQPHSIRSV